MTLLAIESSCDETSVAVVRQGAALSNAVSSQIKLHAEYGGVVPELAAREHLKNLTPVAVAALETAGVAASELDAVAATRGPGLPGALMIGCRAAQSLAYVLRKPFLGIHHHEAHLFSPWTRGDPPTATWEELEPHASLIVSGGHTLLVHARGLRDYEVLGGTIDDAAGECFDKIAKLAGLPYPGGPEVDRRAKGGDPKAFEFPRPMIREASDDFSFSGLKTSVRYFLRDRPGLLDDPGNLRNFCAGVQAAIVDVLVTKLVRAALRLGVSMVTASGGVTCNRELRRRLEEACLRAGLRCRIADPRLSTDNAAMVGLLAEAKLSAGARPSSYDADIAPGWLLSDGDLESQSSPRGEN